MIRILTLLVLLTGCEFPCRDYVARAGESCTWASKGQELVLERTSPLAPPVAVCRCPAPKEVHP